MFPKLLKNVLLVVDKNASYRVFPEWSTHFWPSNNRSYHKDEIFIVELCGPFITAVDKTGPNPA